MVAYTACSGCMTGNHEAHHYWIQEPPEGVMGGFACRCSGPDECAGNGEKLLRSLFGDEVIDRAVDEPDPCPALARLEAAEQLREAADDIRGARLGTDLDDIADELGKRAEQVEAGER